MRALLLLAFMASAAVAEVPTVGIEGRLDALLPLPELKAKPPGRASPLTVRIAGTRPHGALIQYDLRYIGLVPGDYDLRTHLVRDGDAPTDDLPPLPVKVAGILPPDHRGELKPVRSAPFGALGGYRWLIGVAAVVWVLAALPLFLVRRRTEMTDEPAPVAPPTLADRLRPLVECASAGTLTADQQAHLERLLLAHWRQRLGLENLDAHEAMLRLRENPEAGALLRALEDWLHRRPSTVKVDVESMLAPYAGPPG